MKKKNPINDENLFADIFGDVKPIRQNKIHVDRLLSKPKKASKSTDENEQRAVREASFFFSDEYVPNLDTNKALSYVRDGVPSFEAKQLRRGDFHPDIQLDLHGLNQPQSKIEIAALINHCYQQHLQCACIIHGIGSKVLKEKVPHWLAQHPNVRAFHQAPLQWGGKGALLVLLEIPDKPEQRLD